MSRLKSAVQAHLDATQKPLPPTLTTLLQKVDGSLVVETNGKLSIVPQSQITIVDPDDNQDVDVPLTMNLGLLASIRAMSDEHFTELVIASLTGDATVSFQSYLKSQNHYISIVSAKSEEDDESDDSNSSSSRRRSGRRGNNRA